MKKLNKKILKLICAGLTGAVACTPFLAHSSDALAGTGGKTANTAILWTKSQVGKGIDYDGVYGNQCVDLIKAYYVYLGQSQPFGNGSDYTRNAVPNGWKRLQGVQPQKGDVLVYTGGYGGYGHVAIYESDRSHYHQNFNYHSYVERVTYIYNGNWDIKYWGVIRPDFPSGSSGTSAQKTVSVTGVKLNKTSASLTPGASLKLSATVSPVNASNKKVTWTSSNNKVATVDSSGNITAVNTGSTTITVKTADSSKTASAKITVSLPQNGFAKVNGVWRYYNKGRFDGSYTGFALSVDNKWYFAQKGLYNNKYTGLAYNKNNNGWYFARNGKYDNTYTGLAPSTNGKWYYVNRGRWDTTYTGLAKSTNGKFYYSNKGRWDTSYTGFAKYTDGKWYFVKNGRYDTSYTGLAYNVTNNGWFYAKNGKYDNTYTGISKSTNGKLYYVRKGHWDTSFSGKVKYNNKTYTVKNGRVV